MSSSSARFISHVFPGSPAIDSEAIEHLRLLEDEDEPDIVGELVRLFLANTPPRIANMVTGVKSGDLLAVGRAAHSLKSSSAHLGAIGMQQVCEKLEALKDSTHVDEAAHLVGLLQREFEVVGRALQQIASDD
jgi:HPt (histidine-containing phosphotransfer) domain-containing protein